MIIYNILNFEVSSTPLSKILSVLDILLAKMQEWQKYASKKTHSLEEEMKAIIILIRRYRKIEILTWKGLLK
jgi:midasin (ATPase involved in ribosome maturation)